MPLVICSNPIVAVLAQDDFDDTDGTDLTSHVMNVGSGWTVFNGAWWIQFDQAEQNGNVTNPLYSSVALTAVPNVDMTVSVDININVGENNAGLALRSTDHLNGLNLNWDSYSGLLQMLSVVAGVVTTTTLASLPLSPGPHTFKAVIVGNSIDCYVDSSGPYNYVDAVFTSNSLIGMTSYVAAGYGGVDAFTDFLAVP